MERNHTILHPHMLEENPDDDDHDQIYNLTDITAGIFINNKVHHQGPGPSKNSIVPTTTSAHQFYPHEFTGIPITSNRGFVDYHALIGYEERQIAQAQARGLSLSLSSSNRIGFVQGPAQVYVRNSKYLGPAMDLLHETCNLADDDDNASDILNLRRNKNSDKNHREFNVVDHSIHSLDPLQLQIRKTKLIQLLQDLDRRYNHYSNQMKAVVQPFEAVAGMGAAKVYSSMASRTMSRHFRCLKDSIFTQIKVTKKAIDEKNYSTAATKKGETPRLRFLDQKIRQQKALQQMASMEAHPWRPQRGLPERSVSVLRAWFFEHFLHPYPSDVDKHILSRQTGLSRSQVSNWFINARVRLWKPMVEEMYSAEVNESVDQRRSSNDDGALDPTAINKTPKLGEGGSYGAAEIDFSSYSGGVSLTLGLHRRLSPPSPSYFEDGQYPSATSLVDTQNLCYRNMMEAQLLHDLGG